MPTFRENYGKYVDSSFCSEFYLDYDAMKDILKDVKKHGLKKYSMINSKVSLGFVENSKQEILNIITTEENRSDNDNHNEIQDEFAMFETFFLQEFNREVEKAISSMTEFADFITFSLINEESHLTDDDMRELALERKNKRHTKGRNFYTVRKSQIQTLYKQVESLCILRELNILTAIRILKKHDRILSLQHYDTKLYPSVFNESSNCIFLQEEFKQQLDDLKIRVKECFAKLSCNGDIHEAEHKLIILKDRKNVSKILLTYGLLGIIITLIFWFIWDFVVPPNARYSLSYDPILYMYGFVGNIIIYKSLWAIQTYVWDFHRINYSYLLEMRDKQAPDYIEIFYDASIDFVLFFLNLIFYVTSRRGNDDPTKFGGLYFLSFLPPYFFPICLMTIFLLRQLKDALYPKNQNGPFTLKIMKSIVTSPFSKVRLKETFAADILTSLSRVMFNGAYTTCYFVTGAVIVDPLASQYSLHSFGMCTRTNALAILNALFFAFPSLFRFLQCVRVIYERTPNDKILFWPQSLNSVKYIFSIIMALVQVLRPINLNRPILAGFNIAGLIILTFFTTFWDILMDWGLLQRHITVIILLLLVNLFILLYLLPYIYHEYLYYKMFTII